MFDISSTKLESLAIHIVNPHHDIKLGDKLAEIANKDKQIFISHLLKHFKDNTFYSFTGLNLFDEITEFFDGKLEFLCLSQRLAQQFVSAHEHHKVKPGELMICHFKNLVFDGEVVDGLGVFKTEQRENFVVFHVGQQGVVVEPMEGTVLSRLDKGCLIFDTERQHRLKVMLIDNSNKADAVLWRERFLGLQRRKDDFYCTQQVLQVCHEFAQQVLEQPAEVVAFKAKTKAFFSENENFSMENFQQQVFQEPESVQLFEEFAKQYEAENQIAIDPEFHISAKAVKKDKKIFRSVLKLDRNFHIYIHGNHEYIERGYDKTRDMNFYRLFFKNEEPG